MFSWRKKLTNKIYAKLCAFVPAKVSNVVVVNVLDFLRKLQRIISKDFVENLKNNEACFLKHIDAIKNSDGYVEDQNSYEDMKYGKTTMKFAGCEIFATYNAIFNLLGKNEMSLSKMISEFEKDGMVLSGKFGTAPRAIEDFLKRQGFHTFFTTKESEFDRVGEEHQTLILTMYNDKTDLSKEVHTVNISKKEGMFTAHNVYCNGMAVGPYRSVSEVIRNINLGKAKGISLIGIKKDKA